MTHAYHILVQTSEYMSFFLPPPKRCSWPVELCPAAALAASFSCSKVLDSSGAVNFITSGNHFCTCRTVKWHLPGGFCAQAHLLCLSQLLIVNAPGAGLESPSYFHHWIMCEISSLLWNVTWSQWSVESQRGISHSLVWSVISGKKILQSQIHYLFFNRWFPFVYIKKYIFTA